MQLPTPSTIATLPRGISLLALLLLLFSCQETRWLTPSPPTDQSCSPISRLSTTKPAWKASFGGQAKGAWGCLQMLYKTDKNNVFSIPVFLSSTGKVTGWNDSTKAYDSSPTFPLGNASPPTERKYKLFVLQPEALAIIPLSDVRHSTASTLCKATASPSYNCNGPGQEIVCWFTISFAMDATGSINQCQLDIRDRPKEPPPDKRETIGDASEPTPEQTGTDAIDGGNDATKPDKAECEFDIDCPQGSICSFERVCRKGDCDAKKPPSCTDQKICQNYQCVSLACATSKDCPDNAYCKDSLCRPKACGTQYRRCPFRQLCADFRCIQRKPCQRDTDCPSGDERCLRFVAIGGDLLCVKKCLSSLDCPQGQSCRSVEGQNDPFCFQEAQRQPKEKCAPPDQNCIGDYLCLRRNEQDTEGRCRKSCKDIGGTSDCPSDHVCENTTTSGVCLPFGEKKLGESCDTLNARCIKGLVCTTFESIGKSLCQTRCKPKAQPTTCPTGKECFALDDERLNGACATPVIRKEGESCSFREQICDKGLECLTRKESKARICLKPCQKNEDCSPQTCTGDTEQGKKVCK